MAQPSAATLLAPAAPHLENGLIDVTPAGEYVAITNANNRESPLLCLPAELRAMIWGHALGGHTIRPYMCTIDQDLVMETGVKFRKPNEHRFSLLRVCRQIYIEAAIFPYALITFALTKYNDISLWIKAMSPHEAALVRYCRRIKAGSTSYSDFASLLPLHGSFQDLETLEMQFHLPSGLAKDSKTQQKAQDGWEQYHKVAVEMNISRVCDWYSQWATGDRTAKCKACV